LNGTNQICAKSILAQILMMFVFAWLDQDFVDLGVNMPRVSVRQGDDSMKIFAVMACRGWTAVLAVVLVTLGTDGYASKFLGGSRDFSMNMRYCMSSSWF
jgi:hypothetical protein